MAQLIKQDPDVQIIEAATMQSMASRFSNTEEVASTGKLVVLITTVNGGGSQHYGLFDSFGEDVVSALHENDAAFKILEISEFEKLASEIVANFSEGGILDVQMHAFHFGNYYAYYETVV